MKLLSAVLSFLTISAIASTAHALSWNETVTDEEQQAAKWGFIEYQPDGDEDRLLDVRAWAADLNGDGVREVLAVRMNAVGCTASGCEARLLRKGRGEWSVILASTGFVEQFRIQKEKDSGWRQIVQLGSLAQDADTAMSQTQPLGIIDRLWSFGGGTYEETPYYFCTTDEGTQLLEQGGDLTTITRGQTPRLELGEYHLAVSELDIPAQRPTGEAWDPDSEVDPKVTITILEAGQTPRYIFCRGQDTTEPVCAATTAGFPISMATLIDVRIADADALVNDDITKSPTPISAVAACNAVYACEIPLTDPRAKLKIRLFPNF
jgi:hypothetical protein